MRKKIGFWFWYLGGIIVCGDNCFRRGVRVGGGCDGVERMGREGGGIESGLFLGFYWRIGGGRLGRR